MSQDKDVRDICNAIYSVGRKVADAIFWLCWWLFFIAVSQCNSPNDSLLRSKVSDVSNELREIKQEIRKLNNKDLSVDVHVEHPAPVEKQ